MTNFPVYRFLNFELHPSKQQLIVDGKQVFLGSRALDVLEALASRAGHLMTKQELLDLVWPHADVQEANLAVQISALRKELGSDVIATIPGRGYRLIAPVSAARETGPAEDDDSPMAPPSPQPGGALKLRTNLQGWTRPLLGRDGDLNRVQRLLREHRIVTIAGAGGMGKTLLARHLLLDPTLNFQHGVCWVELAVTTDASALPAIIASALGLELTGGDIIAELATWVAPLKMLVALDNAEHLLDDLAALVQRLHDASPDLRILVTSQAPLRLPAEAVYRLAPLAVPPASLRLDFAMQYGAVALLMERARAVDSRFVLLGSFTPHERQQARRIRDREVA